MIERCYFRCIYCERPVAVDCDPVDVREIVKAACPLCGFKDEPLRVMGRVEKARLVKDGVKAACDARCTNAVGPHCSCPCLNANHGTGRLVAYSKDNGVLSVVDKKLLEGNEEYLSKIAELAKKKFSFRIMIQTWLEGKYGDAIQWYKNYQARNDQWNSVLYNQKWSYDKYVIMMKKIEDYKTIAKKVDAYAKLFEEVRIK